MFEYYIYTKSNIFQGTSRNFNEENNSADEKTGGLPEAEIAPLVSIDSASLSAFSRIYLKFLNSLKKYF